MLVWSPDASRFVSTRFYPSSPVWSTTFPSKWWVPGASSEYFHYAYGIWCATISKSSPAALFGSKQEYPWQSCYSVVQKHPLVALSRKKPIKIKWLSHEWSVFWTFTTAYKILIYQNLDANHANMFPLCCNAVWQSVLIMKSLSTPWNKIH